MRISEGVIHLGHTLLNLYNASHPTQPHSLIPNRNSLGAETCNSHMFALSDARDYSFSKVPYLEGEEEITEQSNIVNNVM